MGKLIDLTGRRFGMLVVEGPSGRVASAGISGGVKHFWWCACDCGNRKEMVGSNLRSGSSMSCGCNRIRAISEKLTMQVNASHPAEYKIWQGMKFRCSNAKSRSTRRYQGRGIRVCDRWRESFSNFIADMGPRPTPEHSIDRIDNDGDYEPGNCRWATMAVQARNRSVNRLVTHEGRTMCLMDWSIESGIRFDVLAKRIKAGWAIGRALAQPVDGETSRSQGDRTIDLRGQRFGFWVVLDRDLSMPKGVTFWLCRCDCGREKSLASAVLRRGKSRSCGCQKGALLAASHAHPTT